MELINTKSARRNSAARMGWKDVEFGGCDSAARVQRLQALCAASTKDPGFDGLLIIGGVDSYHSTLSQGVLKYILLGSSGQELLGEQVLSEENDRLEEVVVLLTRHRISIFYSSESDAAVKILPMISQWRNVTEYTYHDAMDPDQQEARKIRAFKEMVSHVKRIGIPYGVDAKGKDLHDPMIPEKWPLVQSYGLEDGGNGKGFFTMNHQIVNVSTLIRQELTKLDDFTAKRVATEVAPLLTHHYNQFLMKLDHAETPAARNSKSEAEMGEDLISFYEFGTTQHEAKGVAMPDHRGSRVLFGKRSSLAASAKSLSTAFLKNSGVSADRPATHMLVQSEDPFSGVRFSRTYFLATGTMAPRVVDEDALVHEQEEASNKGGEDKPDAAIDTQVLIALYVALLRGFRGAVDAFVKQATMESPSIAQCVAVAKNEVVREIKRAMESQTLLKQAKLPANFIDENLVFHAENLDSCGQEVDTLGHLWSLVYISLELKHVPSQRQLTESLGSIAVGDTLLFRSVGKGEPFLNTTSSFAYYRSWVQDGREAASVQALLRVLQSEFMLQSPALQLGRPITPLDAAFDDASTGNASAEPATSIAPSGAPPSTSSIGLSRARLLLESEELPMLDGSMQLFTEGFCFKTPHMIPMLVSFAKHVVSFRIVSTAFEELVLLQLELKQPEPIRRAVPFTINSARTIAFPLLAGTRFQEEIIRALSAWKTTAESLGIPFYRPHDLTQYEGLTPRDEKYARDLPPILAKACVALVRKASSIDGTSAKIVESLFPRWFIPKDANPSTTLPRPKKADRARNTVPMTLVLGLPGSSAASIAATIMDVSSAAYAWQQVNIDLRDEPDKSLGTALRSQLEKRVGAALQRALALSSELPPRLLLCVIGYVDALTVAGSIKTSSSSWPMQTKISTVIGCVSATNTYLPDALGAQSPLPKLFDQLTCGFATHVVITHSSDVPSSAIGRLRYHVDQVNPFADIHVLSSDVFEGSLSPLLSVDRFESAYYKNYRDVHFPKWEEATTQGTTTMDPALSPQCLRFEIAAGVDKTRFLQSIGKTLTPYAALTKSIDKIHPLDPQLMAKQPPVKGGIRLAQSIATEKVLAQTRVAQQQMQDQYGECWCVEAVLSFAGDEQTVYEYVSTGSYMRMRALSQATTKPMELKITGRQLQTGKIRELILGCFVKMDGTVQPLRTKLNLTMQEKREIQKLHVMDNLPEGFYYDGISYIDQFGGRHEFHPRMNEFIDDHVRKLNEATQTHNAKVEENRKSQQTLVRQIGACTCA